MDREKGMKYSSSRPTWGMMSGDLEVNMSAVNLVAEAAEMLRLRPLLVAKLYARSGQAAR